MLQNLLFGDGPPRPNYSTYSAVLYRQPTWVKNRNPQCTYHIREPMQMRFQSTQALCCIAHHCMQNKSLDHTTKNNEKRAMPSIYILLHYSILSPALEGETGRESRMSRTMKIKVTKAISLIYPGCNQVFLHARNNRKGLGHSFKKEYLRKSFGTSDFSDSSILARASRKSGQCPCVSRERGDWLSRPAVPDATLSDNRNRTHVN